MRAVSEAPSKTFDCHEYCERAILQSWSCLKPARGCAQDTQVPRSGGPGCTACSTGCRACSDRRCAPGTARPVRMHLWRKCGARRWVDVPEHPWRLRLALRMHGSSSRDAPPEAGMHAHAADFAPAQMTDGRCATCGAPFEAAEAVPLNGTAEQVAALRGRLAARRARLKLGGGKGSRKRKLAVPELEQTQEPEQERLPGAGQGDGVAVA